MSQKCFIYFQVGFFKRNKKEELERLKERRASRAWETPAGKSDTGTSQGDVEPEVDNGHVNPLVDEMENDETGFNSKDGGLLDDLSNNLKSRHETNGYPVDDKSFD